VAGVQHRGETVLQGRLQNNRSSFRPQIHDELPSRSALLAISEFSSCKRR
jgi:hypothetical protein